MKIELAKLQRQIHRALRHYGYTADEAATIEAVLLYAQMRDNNQGIVKLTGPGLPKDPRAGDIELTRETSVSALVNGRHNMGMLVLTKATDLAIAKAQQHGLGLVGTHHTSTSTGAIGYYARRIAERGLIGFVFAGSIETVSPHGSFQPLFGTNPIAIGVPTNGEPVVLDMATAAMAYYGLIEANMAGRSIAESVAYDRNGRPTTDPGEAMQGALRPFGQSHKGAGLALMVEILTGPLVSASFVGIGDVEGNWGNLVLAMDPGMFVDAETFKQEVDQLVAKVKQAQRLPGVEEIMVPGERGNRLMQERLETGEIEIEDSLYQALLEVAGPE